MSTTKKGDRVMRQLRHHRCIQPKNTLSCVPYKYPSNFVSSQQITSFMHIKQDIKFPFRLKFTAYSNAAATYEPIPSFFSVFRIGTSFRQINNKRHRWQQTQYHWCCHLVTIYSNITKISLNVWIESGNFDFY